MGFGRSAYVTAAAVGSAAVLSCACALPAFAVTRDDLAVNYQVATSTYESALDEKAENAKQIDIVEDEIQVTEQKLEKSKGRLSDSAVAMYKHERNRSDVLKLLLESESITDAIVRFDNYLRVEGYWTDTVEGFKNERARLGEKKDKLEDEREVIAKKITKSEEAMNAAKAAMLDADHSDGAKYHQKQGNGSNCGATSFIVGVNILLHDNRYTDNVAVWEGPGFHGDSTQSLDFKGESWLMANGLADKITCKAVDGDIHYAEQLKAELEQGNVVVISAGPGSVWQRADGTETSAKVFPDGHWIVFYYYQDGLFYSNDSSVGAVKGAGCAYTTKQMQEWLDGRGSHFATVLSKKRFGEEIPRPAKWEDIEVTVEDDYTDYAELSLRPKKSGGSTGDDSDDAVPADGVDEAVIDGSGTPKTGTKVDEIPDWE